MLSPTKECRRWRISWVSPFFLHWSWVVSVIGEQLKVGLFLNGFRCESNVMEVHDLGLHYIILKSVFQILPSWLSGTWKQITKALFCCHVLLGQRWLHKPILTTRHSVVKFVTLSTTTGSSYIRPYKFPSTQRANQATIGDKNLAYQRPSSYR